jgi:hypothetical protein
MFKEVAEQFKSIKVRTGSLFFFGGTIYILGTDAGDKIGSDLVWSGSVILFGLFVIAGAFFAMKIFKNLPFTAFLALAGIGMIGFGATSYDSTMSNAFVSIGWAFFSLAAIWMFMMEKKLFSYISLILGLMALLTLVLWAAGINWGYGGTYNPETADFLISPWLIGFGIYMMKE